MDETKKPRKSPGMSWKIYSNILGGRAVFNPKILAKPTALLANK
jgi:hypothetical protein